MERYIPNTADIFVFPNKIVKPDLYLSKDIYADRKLIGENKGVFTIWGQKAVRLQVVRKEKVPVFGNHCWKKKPGAKQKGFFCGSFAE